MNPIYLENIGLALQMREAGFDKKCFFKAYVTEEEYFNELNITAKNICLERLAYEGKLFEGILQLPTLGEIELPAVCSVYKDSSGAWRIDAPQFYFEECYPTELEARAHAWLWANQKEKEVQNGN